MRPQLRLGKPGATFDSFLGSLDIKLGAEIVLLFGLINKVAGVYGLIVVFVGGSFTQLTFYAYSVATLFAFLWALKTVKSESANPTTTVAHLYTLDHLIQSLFHYSFYLTYWYIVPHDGRRTANSQAQQDLINLAASRHEIIDPATQETPGMDELRKALAGDIWRTEKVYAGWTLIAGFFLKVYFVLILYSYAAHLRSSTYHTLPLASRNKASQIAHPAPQSSSGRVPGDAESASLGNLPGSSSGASAGGSSSDAGPSQPKQKQKDDKVGKEMERLRQEEEQFTWE